MATILYETHLKEKLNELYLLKKNATKTQMPKIDDTISIIKSILAEKDYDDVDFATLCDGKAKQYSDDEFYIPLSIEMANQDFVIRKNRYNSFPKVNDAEMLELMKAFFKDVATEEMYEKFLRIYKNRKSWIHFRQLKDCDFFGDTCFLPHYNEAHIRVKKTGNFTDFRVLAHELGHAIQFFTNYNPEFYEENGMFSEIISTFFELLLCDYMKRFPKFKNAADQDSIFMRNFNIQRSRFLLLENELMLHWLEIKYKTENKDKQYSLLCKEMQNLEYDYDMTLDGDLDLLFSLDLHKYTPYIIGYVIAIELFSAYKSDPELGKLMLEEYMNIDLSLKRDEYYRHILGLGIKPNQNLENYKKLILK